MRQFDDRNARKTRLSFRLSRVIRLQVHRSLLPKAIGGEEDAGGNRLRGESAARGARILSGCRINSSLLLLQRREVVTLGRLFGELVKMDPYRARPPDIQLKPRSNARTRRYTARLVHATHTCMHAYREHDADNRSVSLSRSLACAPHARLASLIDSAISTARARHRPSVYGNFRALVSI